MTEIINILKEELKYDGVDGHKGNSNSGSAKKTSYNNTQCRNYVKLENKLKETTNNLCTMTLISEILSEGIRDIKQETHVASNNINNDNRWQSVKTNNSSHPNSAMPSMKEQISHGISNSRHYMVPVKNRYTVLSRHQDELTTKKCHHLLIPGTQKKTQYSGTSNASVKFKQRKLQQYSNLDHQCPTPTVNITTRVEKKVKVKV